MGAIRIISLTYPWLDASISNPTRTYSFTYDHRALNTRLPVRSAIFKQRTGGLVVRWVTTGESPLLYVFTFLLATYYRRNTFPFAYSDNNFLAKRYTHS
ncbi:hypothetical protein HBI82_085710 [Parastagonospora nodorum]|nr:hypothetical protein HBI82_085710 [Parastagonospora nodorum]